NAGGGDCDPWGVAWVDAVHVVRRHAKLPDRRSRAPETNPEFEQAVQPLTHEQTRSVLRYLASEINRTFFRFYGWMQVLIGLLLAALLWRQSPRDTVGLVLVSVMLSLALVLTLIIQLQVVLLVRR